MGITAGTLKTAFERGLVQHHNVKILTRGEAAKIYEVLYWGPSKALQMPWPLNLLHFDAAVHLGVGGSRCSGAPSLHRPHRGAPPRRSAAD